MSIIITSLLASLFLFFGCFTPKELTLNSNDTVHALSEIREIEKNSLVN